MLLQAMKFWNEVMEAKATFVPTWNLHQKVLPVYLSGGRNEHQEG
jgi:hypothetical protein